MRKWMIGVRLSTPLLTMTQQTAYRLTWLLLALAIVGLASACHRSSLEDPGKPNIILIVPELIPPPCAPNAAPTGLERRMATERDDRPTDAVRLIVRVVNADSHEWLAGARVLVDTRRASATTDAGVYALDSLAPGRHGLRVHYVGFLPLDESLILRAGYTDTLIAHLARWCR